MEYTQWKGDSMTDQQYTTILALLSRIADAVESKGVNGSNGQLEDEAKAEKMECPECGGHMTFRRSKKTNKAFAGCTRWPDCTGIRWMNGEVPKPKGEARVTRPAVKKPPLAEEQPPAPVITDEPQDDVPF